MLSDPSLPRDQRVNISKSVRDLNLADWVLIHRAFDAWPFKPQVRHTFLTLLVARAELMLVVQDLMIGDVFMADD